MDSVDIILWAAGIASILAWSALRAEMALRRRFARRRGPKPDTVVPPELMEKSVILGAVEGIVCGCERHMGPMKVFDYVTYADGDLWCIRCDEIEED